MLIRIIQAKLKNLRQRRILGSRGNAHSMFFPPLLILLLITSLIILSLKMSVSSTYNVMNMTEALPVEVVKTPKDRSIFNLSCYSTIGLNCECNSTLHCQTSFPLPARKVATIARPSPYHNWQLFDAEYQEMLKKLKIFVYPDVSMNGSSPFASVFRPHPDPLNPRLGNYFSEYAFKLALLKSSFVTKNPEEAHFFFLPFSINAMRNHPLVRSESSISEFVASYVSRISSEFEFWNVSGGADHFFVSCHSVGREAAWKQFSLRNNAIQITCSSSYFQRLYAVHKDIALPQVWPRASSQVLNPPDARNKLVFFAGREQNSLVRKELMALWGNDTSFSIFTGPLPFPYEEGFRTSKFCLHVKGYEVNTARLSDAIHYGCVPVIISNHYDLPFANILDWRKFSIIVSQADIPLLKQILTSVSKQMYLNLFENLSMVRKHFRWHDLPTGYDSFYMIAYQLWLRRGLNRMVS